MKPDNILVFNLTGDFAHFRMGYTTSSSSTHMVPPRHTIAGIIGAIMGIERNELSDLFHPDRCKIGVTVENKLSLLRISINQMLVKGKISLENIMTHDQHSQIPFQMVKNPRYRIYFGHEDKQVYSELKELLQNHECVYPPSLGMAQLLANTDWVGELGELNFITSGKIKTKSVAPLDLFNPHPDTISNHMVMDRQARHLDSRRQADQYYRVVIDINGKTPLEGELIPGDVPADVIEVSKDDIPEVVFIW